MRCLGPSGGGRCICHHGGLYNGGGGGFGSGTGGLPEPPGFGVLAPDTMDGIRFGWMNSALQWFAHSHLLDLLWPFPPEVKFYFNLSKFHFQEFNLQILIDT